MLRILSAVDCSGRDRQSDEAQASSEHRKPYRATNARFDDLSIVEKTETDAKRVQTSQQKKPTS